MLLPVLALATASPAATAPPRLTLPVDCALGSACVVQKLPDHGGGPARADYRCGTLTTDDHDGTDIRVAEEERFRLGVPIVAAAPGRVLRVRDGEPDVSVQRRGGTGGRDAGNGIVLDHGGGWTTQYSHARRGSIAVRPGQTVVAGQRIATVGLSGNTEYPHLHFTVRHDDEAIDPFTGNAVAAPCGAAAGQPLWRVPIPYAPTALIAVGLAASAGDLAAPARDAVDPVLARDRPILLWADVIGARPGDEQRFTIVGPGGDRLLDARNPVGRGGLDWFAVAGRRAPAGGWPAGRYRGRYELRRQGLLLIRETEAVVEPR